MKRMTRKLYGILILSMLATSAHAGWLSNLGQRIVNGAANTVQSNISGKVNRTIDNAMDGKLQQVKKGNTQTELVENSKVQEQGTISKIDINTQSIGRTGKTISFTNNYKRIDFGGLVFSGEDIFYRDLLMGQKNTLVDEFLEPGFYLIHVIGTSYDVGIMFAGVREDEGVKLGYGINIRKMIANDRNLFLTGNSNGIIYVVEVLPNTLGHLEVVLVNHQSLKGSGNLSIYKIPGPTLK